MSDPKSIILLFLEPITVTVVYDAMFYNNEPNGFYYVQVFQDWKRLTSRTPAV